MIQQYKDKIKKMGNSWIFDKNFECNCILSDDMDSLLSFLLIEKYRKLWHLGYFFSYSDGLYEKFGIDKSLPTVGIDISLCQGQGRCLSNHVVKTSDNDFINKEDINLNNIDGVNAGNFFYKYNLNTLLLVYSLLNVEPMSDMGKIITLLVDSAYLPYYQPPDYMDSYIQEKYLCNIMGLQGVYDIQAKMSKEKFINAQDAINIKSKLYASDSGLKFVDDVDLKMICKYLNLNYNPALFQGFYFLKKRYKGFTDTVVNARKYDKNKFFCFSITGRNKCKFCKEEEDGTI